MQLNLDVVGKTYEPAPFKYNWKTCATYALGIGAGVGDLDYTWQMTWSLCPAVPTISLERAHRVAENSVTGLMAAIERPGYS